MESERGGVEQELKQANQTSENLTDNLRLMTNERDKIVQEKRNLEVSLPPPISLPSSLHPFSFLVLLQLHCQTINENLSQAQEKLNQYLANSQQLTSQIDGLKQQQVAILQDKEQMKEENSQLLATVSDLQRSVQELEAQKDQLEQDRYTTQTSLEELETRYEKVCSVVQEITLFFSWPWYCSLLLLLFVGHC